MIAQRLRTHVNRLVVQDERLAHVRPDAEVWSALEYVCHMRDVVSFYEERIVLVCSEHRPQLSTMDFGKLADDRRYQDDDLDAALAAVEIGARSTVEFLVALGETDWQRAGVGSGGGDRTVLVLARRLAHEGHHQVLDLDRGRDTLLDGERPALDGLG